MHRTDSLFQLALAGLVAAQVGCPSEPVEDADQDGVTVDGGDCDDFNNRVLPGAAEVVGDGIDQDCDGVDLAPADPLDVDNDGDGVTENAGDCDDANNTINPSGVERPQDGLDSDCDGEDGPVVISEVNVVKPFAEFAADCETAGGLVQMHAYCFGNNTCRGMSYGDWGEDAMLMEHTCRGMNGCNGWSCVLMGEGQDRDGATAYADHCQDCHGYANPEAFTVMVNPALESDAVVDAFFGQDEERWRTSIAFGVVGRTSSDHAFANMRAYYKDLSLAEIDAIIAHIRTLELEPYDYHYGDGSN